MTMNTETGVAVVEEIQIQAARVATVREIYDTNRKLSELWGRLVRAEDRNVDTSALEEEFRKNQQTLARLQAEIDAQCRAFRTTIDSAKNEAPAQIASDPCV